MISLRGGPALPPALVEQWRAGHFCDVEICVENEVLKAQRSILAASAEYFRGLFVGGGAHMSDVAEQIELREMSAVTMRFVLDWIYEGKCTVPRSVLFDLLAAAGRLQIDSLQCAATWSIVGHELNDSNCFETWEMASSLSAPVLEEQAKQYALTRFEAVASASDLRALSADRLTTLLSSHQLVAKEDAVLDILLAWARAHEASATVIAQQLALVRFDRFLDPGTARRASASPLLASQECMTVLAQKLAAQVDPQVPSSPARRKPDEYSPRTGPEVLEMMRLVARECREAALLAKWVADHDEWAATRVIGPLTIYMRAKQPAFENLLVRSFPPKMPHKIFVNVTETPWTLPAGRGDGMKLLQCGTSVLTPPAFLKDRPPARELYRFVPHELHDSVQLAWADEMIHIDDDGFKDDMIHIDGLIVTKEMARLRILQSLWDTQLMLPCCLLCTYTLSPEVVLALQTYMMTDSQLPFKIVMPRMTI
jgi:hypothetical protein